MESVSLAKLTLCLTKVCCVGFSIFHFPFFRRVKAKANVVECYSFSLHSTQMYKAYREKNGGRLRVY